MISLMFSLLLNLWIRFSARAEACFSLSMKPSKFNANLSNSSGDTLSLLENLVSASGRRLLIA